MEQSPEESFKNNLLVLFDEVNDMFSEGVSNGVINNSINILPLIKLYIKKTDADHMIKRFIKRTHKYWDVIKRKDDNYIKEQLLDVFNNVQEKGVESIKENEDKSNKIINALSGDHFVVFKDLLSKSYQYDGEEIFIMDDERKEYVWKIMHSFVRHSLLYIHKTRKPIEGGKGYAIPFFNEGEDEIHVKELAKEWNVKSIL